MRQPLYRWIRVTVQWLSVGLAHAVVLGSALQASPPPIRTMPRVIQANLIAPAPLPVALSEQPPSEKRLEPPKLPPKTPPPKKSKPPKKTSQKPPEKKPEIPKPLLTAAPVSEEAPAPSYEVAQPPAESSQSVTEANSSTSSTPTSAGNPASGTLIAPVFNADYLENPPPAYPQLSRQRGEAGRVLLRVFVSADGRAKRVELNKSSGFERLDTAARNAVSGWRFVPARRGSEHVAAWVLVPISFVL